MAAQPAMPAWEVFARHASEDAAQHIGRVHAASPSDAEVFAFTIFDERRWAELFVAPRDAVHVVIGAS